MMFPIRAARVFVAFAAVAFAALALVIWFSPREAARLLGLDLMTAAGATSMRAEAGGLFAGLAALCTAAAWTRSRASSLAAAAVLSGVVIGRLIGWLDVGVTGDAPALAIELTAITSLLALSRSTRPASVPERRSSRHVVIGAAAACAVLAGIASLSNGRVQQTLFATAARQTASTVNTTPFDDDALRVAICGSSAPLPSAARAKSCVAVFAGGKFYVVDVGPESVENLVLWGIPLSRIGGVLLTHFHSDHIGDLGELNLQTWAGGRPSPLSVYGGPGVERVVEGFNRAYQLDQGYRTAHHTATVMPPETWPMVPRTIELAGAPTSSKDRGALVLDADGLRITAIEVDHAPIEPAYAYRFDYRGRSVVITGDLKYHEPLARAAAGADVIVSEAIAVHMTRALGSGAQFAGRDSTAKIMHDIEDYHITPVQAAQIANAAGARLLVFYHLLPAPDGVLARNVFAQGIDAVRPGGWTIADDGSLYTLPLGSTAVEQSRIGR